MFRSFPIIVALLVGATNVAVAQEAGGRAPRSSDHGFGHRGTWAFSTDAAFEIRHRTQPDAPASTSLTLLPAFDYFVIRNLSLGGAFGVKYVKTGDNKTTDFQLGPRVGYDFELSDMFSIWPKIGLLYAHGKYKEEGDASKNDAPQLNLFVPFVIHPAKHFFVGFGPFIETDLAGNNRVTQWGLKLTFGGWL